MLKGSRDGADDAEQQKLLASVLQLEWLGPLSSSGTTQVFRIVERESYAAFRVQTHRMGTVSFRRKCNGELAQNMQLCKGNIHFSELLEATSTLVSWSARSRFRRGHVDKGQLAVFLFSCTCIIGGPFLV